MEITIKDMIAELALDDSDTVFIHEYGKRGEKKILVSDISKSDLRKKIKLVKRHYGGQAHKYQATLFITKK